MKVTISLILANILIFIFTWSSLKYYIENYGFKPKSFLEGKYYLALTSIFLHANEYHLGLNVLALFFLGSALEREIGSSRYLLVYFLGGIFANFIMLLPFLYSPESVGVGASGAISALVGTGTFLCPGRLTIFPFSIPLPFVVVGALYFLINTSNLFTQSVIGYPVHVAGMLIGSIFGLKWSKNWKKGLTLFIVTLVFILSLPYLLRILGFE